MRDESVRPGPFYRLTDPSEPGPEGLLPQASTAGPWSAGAQHGGPPAGLLVRALEQLPGPTDGTDQGADQQADQETEGTRVLGRVTVEILGPVPLTPLRTSARVLRPGRSVSLVEAELHDVAAGRVVARATGWSMPRRTDGPRSLAQPGEQPGDRPDDGPEDGLSLERPPGWLGGYLDAIEWRWISGTLERPGPGVAWMRCPDLVGGEGISATQRLLTCVDSASGIGSALDVTQWRFLNTELTVHVLRPPVGPWLRVSAATTLAGTAVGLATSDVHDRDGLVARSAQTLLVTPR